MLKLLFISALAICGFVNTPTAQAAAGDITAVRIMGETPHNGWVAEIDIEGLAVGGSYNLGIGPNSDPTNANIVFTVTSPGFDENGDATTITRTIYGTQWVRKTYPNDTEANETDAAGTLTTRVSLSDFIYSGDTSITATIGAGFYTNGTASNAVTNIAVTNNSVHTYPKVVGRWAWPGYERVTDDFLVEAVVFNRFAQHGKPVAAVTFTASDQSGNTVTETVTTMTKTTRSGDANEVLVYAATIPITSLTQGEIITVNFEAFPWVGDASAKLNSATSADGFAQPEERLGPLTQVLDKTGGYGVAYALVSNSGTTSTTTGAVVFSSQAAAETATSGQAFSTIGRAAAAIKAYQNTNFGRNSAGGGVILLAEGSFSFPGFNPPDLGAMDTWMIVRPASFADKADTIINGGTNVQFPAQRLKIEGVTIATTTGTNTFRGRTATDVLWMHGNTVNVTQTAPFYSFTSIYATQNQFTSSFSFGSSITRSPVVLIRGNDSTARINAELYSVLGNKNILGVAQETGNTKSYQISDNTVYAFNSVYGIPGAGSGEWFKNTIISHGFAFIQNVWESLSAVQPLLQISADNSTATTSNIMIWNNSFSGERQNLGYNDNGTVSASHYDWSQRANIFKQWNNKDDTFTTPNAARVGAWPVGYNIGSNSNLSKEILFRGEFDGLHTVYGTTPTYTNDRSIDGIGGGNGDYTLASTSIAIDLATTTSSFIQTLPFDFLGNSIYGSRDAGAYEFQPPFTMGSDEVSTSTTIRMYGNEKFRNKTTPLAGGTAELDITIPTSDTTRWLDVRITTWENTGTREKIWTETSSTTGLTNTAHTVGDLAANTTYAVSVDSVVGANITGASCTSGICTSNSSGEITFTYTGSYSTHTFNVEQSFDTVAPTISAITITPSQTSATITWTTNEVATSSVTYGLRSAYDSASSSITLVSSHAITLTGLSPATLYHYQVSAADAAGNVSTSTDLTFTTTATAIPNAGGGGSSATRLRADTKGVPTIPPPLPAATSTGTSTPLRTTATSSVPRFVFTRDLTIGSTGADVRTLQIYLNANGFILSATGPGSAGNETAYFGALTKNAVIRLQAANGIFPIAGYFGPLTRNYVMNH